MTYIFDASFSHAAVTPQAVKTAGAVGVILYAGCADVRKNTSPAEVKALLEAGLMLGLVIENVNTDALGGIEVGVKQGHDVVAAAKTLGYDWQNCVLFAGYDADAGPADMPKILNFMKGFAMAVPHPGYYGDSDSIDYLFAQRPEWVYWQSDSTSFSPKNPTPNATFLQRYNDPRAGALRSDADVDDVLKTPTRLMGEDVALDPKDPVIVALQKQIDEVRQLIMFGGAKHPNSIHAVLAELASLKLAQTPSATDVAKALIAELK